MLFSTAVTKIKTLSDVSALSFKISDSIAPLLKSRPGTLTEGKKTLAREMICVLQLHFYEIIFIEGIGMFETQWNKPNKVWSLNV
jgi:hypothetical protein